MVAKKGGGWWLRRGWVAKLEARLLATEDSGFEPRHPLRKSTHSSPPKDIQKLSLAGEKFELFAFNSLRENKLRV
jgi:hypothetical protein